MNDERGLLRLAKSDLGKRGYSSRYLYKQVLLGRVIRVGKTNT